jgi:hypothetical protein
MIFLHFTHYLVFICLEDGVQRGIVTANSETNKFKNVANISSENNKSKYYKYANMFDTKHQSDANQNYIENSEDVNTSTIKSAPAKSIANDKTNSQNNLGQSEPVKVHEPAKLSTKKRTCVQKSVVQNFSCKAARAYKAMPFLNLIWLKVVTAQFNANECNVCEAGTGMDLKKNKLLMMSAK